MRNQIISRVGAHQGAGPVLPQRDDHECDTDVPAGPARYFAYHGANIAGQGTSKTQIGPRRMAKPDQVSQVKRRPEGLGADGTTRKAHNVKPEVRSSGVRQLAADGTRIA